MKISSVFLPLPMQQKNPIVKKWYIEDGVYPRGIERSTPSVGVMSSNPESRRPNSCEERGLSGCRKGLKTVPQALLSLKPAHCTYYKYPPGFNFNLPQENCGLRIKHE